MAVRGVTGDGHTSILARSDPVPGGDAHRAQNTRLAASCGATGAAIAYLGWICRRSGSGSVVVVQQSAETFQSFHFATLTDESWIRGDQLVIEALMVAFTVVMRSEFGRRATHRAFAK